jgi:AcrR family transcriptional regulator
MEARNPQPPRLSRERIVDASLGVLEKDGWEALSMRRLAQELDVWPMAVYRYFRDKDELVDALVGHAVETLEAPAVAGGWRNRLHGLLEAARARLERLPPELRSRLGAVLFAPDREGLAASGIEALEEAGFEPDQATAAWSALGAFTIGYVEIAPVLSDAAEFDFGLDRLLDGFELALSGDRPHSGVSPP